MNGFPPPYTRAALVNALHFGVGPIFERPNAAQGALGGRRLIVKDLFHIAGAPTFAGCDIAVDACPSTTAPAAQSLIAAGAIYIGKSQMVQLAFGGWGTNACAGPPRNPWDASAFRVAGGSSSGSAVAVVAGFADLALGSDTGGSIRIPASLCGLVGLKPSQARISLEGVVPLAPSLDSVGPMARTVSEVAAAFAVLVGEPPIERPSRLEGLTLRTLTGSDLVADDAIVRTYSDVVARLGNAGATIAPVALIPSPGDYVGPTGQIMGHEAWMQHGARITAARGTADPGVLRRFEAVSTIDTKAYHRAQATRATDRQRFAEWFAGADFLMTPATACTAPRIEHVDEGDFTLARYTRMANYLDLCAIALPCGVDEAGLPIGLQVIGRAGDEARLIAAAWAIERLLNLPPRVPPLHVSHCVG